jgi:Bacterial Ig domain
MLKAWLIEGRLLKAWQCFFLIAVVILMPLSDASARRFGNRDVTDIGNGTCLVSGGGFNFTGGPWTRSMTVTAGSECGGTFGAAGRVVFKRLYLVTAPQHGTVTLREGGHYHYAARAGYRGADSFMLRVCGIGGAGREHCADLSYAVTVQ